MFQLGTSSPILDEQKRIFTSPDVSCRRLPLSSQNTKYFVWTTYVSLRRQTRCSKRRTVPTEVKVTWERQGDMVHHPHRDLVPDQGPKGEVFPRPRRGPGPVRRPPGPDFLTSKKRSHWYSPESEVLWRTSVPSE